MSILNKMVSYYPSVWETEKGITVNLLTLLQSQKHAQTIKQLRNETNETLQKKIKEKLPCYTVAGTFKSRAGNGLIQLSGLAAVDLDSTEDFDIAYLLPQLKKLPYIAYTGLSCRGCRLFCIIPFLHPDRYTNHYECLIQSFANMGLPMGDSCHKQISQPRFISYNDDSTCFYNHCAKPYPFLPIERQYHQVKTASSDIKVPTNAFDRCVGELNQIMTFEKGKRHNYVLRLAHLCNRRGIPKSESLDGCLKLMEADFSKDEIENIVDHVYQHNSSNFGKDLFTPAELDEVQQTNANHQAKSLTNPNILTRMGKSQLLTNANIFPIPNTGMLTEANISIIYAQSFFGVTGKFYVQKPDEKNKYAVYTSIKAYNERLHLPEYIELHTAMNDFKTEVTIDLRELTVPFYEDKTCLP